MVWTHENTTDTDTNGYAALVAAMAYPVSRAEFPAKTNEVKKN